MKVKNCGFFLVLIIFLSAGCMSRTHLMVGPAHLAGDLTAHGDWRTPSMSYDNGRTVVETGLVTVGAEAGWKKCKKSIIFEHKTKMTSGTKSGNNGHDHNGHDHSEDVS